MVDLQTAATTVESVAGLIGRLAAFGEKALPVVQVIADFAPIPYASAIVHALTVAQPYLAKVEMVAPIVVKAIEDGRPVLAALQEQGPSLVADLKSFFAIAHAHDPKAVGLMQNVSARGVKDTEVADYMEDVARSLFERSFFSPQDPRFSRDDASAQP